MHTLCGSLFACPQLADDARISITMVDAFMLSPRLVGIWGDVVYDKE